MALSDNFALDYKPSMAIVGNNSSRTRPKGAHALLQVICALALVLSTLFHASALPRQPGGDLSAYRLPDGTLPVLCLPGSAGQKPDGTSGTSCPYCTLASMPALPAAADPITLARALPPILPPERGEPVSGRDLKAGFQARAPPLA